MDKIFIWTDGACRGNGQLNNIGTWAYKLQLNDKIKTNAKAVKNTTNNIMELSAVIEALKALKPAACNYPIEVYSDSQYVVMGINSWIKGWVARNWQDVKNVELWKELLELKSKFPNISFNWVRGHLNNSGNIEMDELCNKLMDEYSE